MVSLGPTFNSIRQGAQYMNMGDHRATTMTSGAITGVGAGSLGSDTQELIDPVLSSNSDGSFKALKTIPAFSIHLLISAIISFVGILLAAVWPEDKRCEAYFIMLYLRATFWVITFLFDHLIKKHHDELRMNGYHEFHRATAMQKGIPLTVVSLWNSMILAVQAGIHHYYGVNFWEHCAEGFLSPVSYIAGFNMLETIVLSSTHGCYISKVRKFNKASPPPDALRGGNNASGSLGLMQPGGNTAELLEKQADLIAYLKDHNQKLNQKLHQMQLTARTVNLTH
ncbi:transmembrane protein 192 isoform X2 [Rhagoletis pomonella]|uniref:transmembrane protein 192 isoform X2 n=1 Tax=Rhagoletis pomonella TaxID=28610 RepID=UPI0017828FD9|nr:transmembrane protein 192 isoform X2 [Rhagoletis pomonella]